MNQLHRRTLRLLLACSLCCGVSVCQSSAPPANASNPPQAAPSAPAKSDKPAATSSSAPTAAKSNSAKAEKKTAPKLTAKQKQAVDMLQAVESDLGRYSPEMQAYLLQQMAQAYQQLDRARQVSLLKEAFQSAANMPEGHYRTEQQTAIVKALNEVDPSALTSM